MRNDALIAFLLWAFFTVTFAFLWALNVYKLILMLDGPINAWFVARVIGIFAAPFGALLGLF